MPEFTCDWCHKHYKKGTLVRVDNQTVCWNCYKKGGK